METNQPGGPRPGPFRAGNAQTRSVRRVKKTGPGPEHKLFAPAVCLIVVSAIATLVLLVSMALEPLILASSRNTSPEQNAMTRMAGFWVIRGLFCLLAWSYYGFLIFGSIEMLRRQNFALAKMTGIMACIPLCSPCFVLGIPFGIWILVVLADPQVQDRFKS